ncbi:hypothetical protein [Streptomyces sp. NPDC003393]
MTLWDAEIGRLQNSLLECPFEDLQGLGLRVIEETVTVYGRPLDELFDDASVTLFQEAIEEFRSFSGASEEVAERWDELFADAYDLQDSKSPFTAASLCQGLAQYADALLSEDAGEGIVEVLSSCYESVLSFASLGRIVTVDMEREDPRCRRAVDLQLTLIEQICGIS